MPPKVLPPVELALPKDFDHEQPYERDRKRMAMVTQRDKVSQHIYDDDRQRLERLIGFNSKNEKEPTLVERYPKEWAELHTPQEKLDYEARMRKYKPMEFFTPYGGVAPPAQARPRRLARADALYDEITSRSAVIPDDGCASTRRSQRSASLQELLPGSNKTPVKDEDKPKTGARTTVAKRLFMKKTIVKPRREGAAVVGIDDGSDFAAGSMATLLPDELLAQQPRQPREPRE
ncbi:hypothetical protein JL721_11274 [Aureococcus anophagefferens]|nr:hypothetical protein JL721_11274 [Aureococcus anophagefferens]